MRKLSEKQQDVLNKMKDGWQLGQSISLGHFRFWIQKGGCGRGGETQDVNAKTAHGLIDRKLIATDKRQFPLETFKVL